LLSGFINGTAGKNDTKNGLVDFITNFLKGFDWLVIIVCIASGLIVYFRLLKKGPDLQSGAYLILIGWIIALGGQILSKVKNE